MTDLRTDLLWRAAVPIAALVALLAGAPPALSGGLALLGVVLATERLAALRRGGLADRLLAATGGLLVVLVLLGLLLDATGIGLGPATWTIGAVVAAATGLCLAAVVPAREASDLGHASSEEDGRRTTIRAVPWVAAAVLVTVVAVRMSTTSLSAADAAPLQLSLGASDGSRIQVVVTSSDAIGPLELRTSSGGTDVSYPLFDLDEDGTSTTLLSVPPSGRYVITLNYPDQTEPLRTLVLDR